MSQLDATKDDFYIDDEHEEASAYSPDALVYSPSDYEDDAVVYQRKRERKEPFNFKKAIIRTAVIILCVIVLAACGCFAFVMNIPQDKVYSGVTCANINLGGMTYDEVRAALSTQLNTNIAGISVRVNNKTYTIASETINLKLLPEETAKKVFNFGKGQNVFKNAYDAALSKLGGAEVLPVTEFDESLLKQELIKIGNTSMGVLTPHSAVLVDENTARLMPGKRGFNGKVDTAVSQIKKSIQTDTYNNIDITLSLMEPEKLTVDQVKTAVNVAPKDAAYAKSNGEFVIAQEKAGIEVDEAKCKEAIELLTVDSGPIDVPCNSVAPTKNSDALKQNLFNHKLGSFSTSYAAGGNRGQNISNAASKLNGTIIVPGEVFSFNSTVGRRTVENGFKSAPEYLNGETVSGIGGGTCQVSTTLYSAVLYSDLKIVSRRNHSMSVGYAPLGQDATVADGGIDFKFENNTTTPIKIEAVTGGGKITISIIGTAPETAKTVKITHANVPVTGGGKAVKTTRTVYDSSGNVIKTESMGVSRYKPHA